MGSPESTLSACRTACHTIRGRYPLPLKVRAWRLFSETCGILSRAHAVCSAFSGPKRLPTTYPEPDTLRSRLCELPPLISEGLWDCQVEAVEKLEESFAQARPRALIQMATGAGKTFTAITAIYRLIKFGKAKRVLFLVDRNNLGRQAHKEFQQYVTPDDGRKFTELYNVQRLTSNKIDPVCKVVITTIQRVYSMLRGEELDPELEELSGFQLSDAQQRKKDVVYNPDIPIEMFDFVITDECHRSIYNLWRQVLEYFDSFLIGLTATPSKQTLGFFNQNLVTEYSHERAVADGVNVAYEVYRIKTQITEGGSTVESGNYIDKRDKLTRERRWEELDEDLQYDSKQLDRSVVSESQIRTVIQTFRDKLPTEIFPGRTNVPKTLVYAKDDSHAEDILHIIREEFGKGNEFAKKITYKTTGETPENLIASFRNSFNPRIAVTVDMIATGTDIKPLECILFMRDIRSRTYFEQMKGRGTRTVDSTTLQAVSGEEARHKTHFVIVDAVGVCETDKTETRPLERKKTVSFEKLILGVALGNRDEDTLSSLAGRLARLDRVIEDRDAKQIKEVSHGKSLRELTNDLLDAIDPDRQIEKAKELHKADTPNEEQLKESAAALTNIACEPFDSAPLRNLLIEIKKRNEQTIDTVSQDTVLDAGWDEQAKERARGVIGSFKQFMEDNKDEITALQLLYSKPFGQRHLTYEQISELAEAIAKPPLRLKQETLWLAYEQLEKSKVRKAAADRTLTDIISLLRVAKEETEVLEPFGDVEDRRFQQWLGQQEAAGAEFTPEQIEWLNMIKDHIATSLQIEMDDFGLIPFAGKGGAVKAYQLFGDALNKMLDELNEVLAA